MKFTKTKLEGCFIIDPTVHGDHRGWFCETFRADELKEMGVTREFVQDNQSFSAKKGTLRGIHYQMMPHAQAKLVRCLRGAILDVAVDLRPHSPTYKQWVSVELSADNHRQIYVPRGFGHAALSLTDDVELAYKNDNYYCKDADRSIRFDDPQIGVDFGDAEFILSQKDSAAPLLSESDCNFGARVLVTGARGQLGRDLVKLLCAEGIEHRGVDVADFDITDLDATRKALNEYKPTTVVNCAAYTAVDKAEGERDKCFAVNASGAANVAIAAKECGASIIHISTDYVYGAGGTEPLAESAPLASLSVYGDSKMEGEKRVIAANPRHFVVRTSWVFGRHGANFVKTMLRLAAERSQISVVDDQIGSPTYTVDLSRLILQMIFSDKYGVYNASNEGFVSWCGFARRIFEERGLAVEVLPLASEQYKCAAKRPLNSRLDKTKLEATFGRLPDWQNALQRFLAEIE